MKSKSLILLVLSLVLVIIIITYFRVEHLKAKLTQLTFTSPHTINTYRRIEKNGQIQNVEHTKELYVREILDRIKAKGLMVNYNLTDKIDPNYEPDSQFRRQVFQGQKYNLDIHGMKDRSASEIALITDLQNREINDSSYDIIIGTAVREYDLNEVQAYLESLGLKVGINKIFTGKTRSLTKYLQEEHGVKAIQIELSNDARQRADIDQILVRSGELFVTNNQNLFIII